MFTRVYSKHSGIVPLSIQQLWLRESLVDGWTTMSSESVSHVASRWVDVGSFHTRLVVRIMIFTVSVRCILDTPSYSTEVETDRSSTAAFPLCLHDVL
jgi:hypothetical protein